MTIYHLTYKIDKEPTEHIYAIKKICEKKKKALLAEPGQKIKFSKIQVA